MFDRDSARRRPVHPQKKTITRGVVLALVSGLVFGLSVHSTGAKPSPAAASSTALDEQFAKGDCAAVLKRIERLEEAERRSFAVRRLKMLCLARLGRTAEGIEEYERLVRTTRREYDDLLRELAIASILPFRGDMREQVRGAAYTALKEIGSNEVAPYLEEGLTDGSGMIRALVVEGLGKLPAGVVSKRFRQALEDRAGWVRATALKMLGRTGKASVIALIEPALEDKQAMVQVTAAGALAMLGKSQYWRRLEQAVVSDEGYERGAAIRMLGELQDIRALPILTKALEDPQPSIRVAAAAALGKLGSSEAIPYLAKALTHGIPSLRAAAAVSLGKLKAKQAVSVLKQALRDRDPGVQAAAIDALLRVDTPFQEVAPTVRTLLHNQNPGVRSGLAKALSQGYGPAVIETLAILLQDPIPRPRILAARSLGRIGDRDALMLLRQALRDSNEAVRATAAGAIARILSPSART